MGSITVLPESVQNQIAAGEVVERPASVLKELLENALDAGADEIVVDYERGGIDRIEVQDNGQGIPREELPRAVERHATSKIDSAQDLESIDSLGFRGEALASISSVSRLTIVSRPEAQSEAYKFALEPGEENGQVEPTARRPGTTVRVEGLFADVPARRKFLKTEATERRHLYRQIYRTALSHPDLRIEIKEAGEQKQVVPVGDLQERINNLLGSDTIGDLISVDALDGNWQDLGRFGLSGFVGTGEVAHTHRRYQFYFVNGRPIREPMLYRATDQAYSEFLRHDDENPPLVLFLDLPRQHLDVNVHPRKEEVRFHHSQDVFRFVRKFIEQHLRDHFRDEVRTGSLDTDSSIKTDGSPDRNNLRQKPSPQADSREQGSGADEPSQPEPRPEAEEGEQETELFDRADSPASEGAVSSSVLGQFRDTYLVVERDSGLMLVDQHTAHERVLYERYMDQARGQANPAQQLSVPWRLDFAEPRAQELIERSEDLDTLGVELESFGGGSVVVHSLPAYLGRRSEDKRAVIGMLEEFLDWTEDDRVSSVQEDLLTIMACRSAVMRGDRLLPREQRELVASLEELSFPARCPHGRAISHEVGNPQLARWFQRPKDDLCAR